MLHSWVPDRYGGGEYPALVASSSLLGATLSLLGASFSLLLSIFFVTFLSIQGYFCHFWAIYGVDENRPQGRAIWQKLARNSGKEAEKRQK